MPAVWLGGCMRFIKCSTLLFLLAFLGHSYAAEVFGSVYPIAEPDALEEIQAKLQAKLANGGLEKLQKEVTERMEKSLENPPAALNLATVQKDAVRYYDPTWIVPENITDHEGNMIALAGTRVNPLAVMPMLQTLILFDGRDADQVAFAQEQALKYPQTIVLMAVAGKWKDLSLGMGLPVYFDQGQVWIKKLGITQVPVRVTQAGLLLKIEEVKPTAVIVTESKK